ncbi:hypothetical protein M3Y94_00690600 [Aphelenchoides besseyi]|nr:hypothetical protein M3Y94_00690600 [Aphelenchoides besseyi]KAI6231522.1 hypothetical protein M3Y95_00390500 [Aphelenchoides besseyi]
MSSVSSTSLLDFLVPDTGDKTSSASSLQSTDQLESFSFPVYVSNVVGYSSSSDVSDHSSVSSLVVVECQQEESTANEWINPIEPQKMTIESEDSCLMYEILSLDRVPDYTPIEGPIYLDP